MPGLDRRPQREKPPAREKGWGEALLHGIGIVVDQALHEAAHRALGESPGQSVDGDEPAGVKRLVRSVVRHLEVLHLHLERPALVSLHLAVDDEALAPLENSLEIALAKPDGREEARPVAQDGRQRRPGMAGRRRTHALDAARAGAAVARRDVAQRDELASILVAGWQVKERVLDVLEAHSGEELRSPRADSLHVRKRGGKRGPRPFGGGLFSARAARDGGRQWFASSWL